MLVATNILLCFLLVLAGAFFAGTEIGLYRLSRFQVRVGAQRKKRSYTILSKLIEDGRSLILSLLIGNNLSNYLLTILVTYILLEYLPNKRTAEAYTTIIVTPTLFLFVDIIPKTVYYYRADTLLPLLSYPMMLFHKIFVYSGAVAVLKALASLMEKALHIPTQSSTAIAATDRHFIKQVIYETRQEGILTPLQNRIMNRLVNISNAEIDTVMTPLARTLVIEKNVSKEKLKAELGNYPYRHIPVFEKHPQNIVGYINIYKALTRGTDFTNLEGFIEPAARLNINTTVIDAIDILRTQHREIAAVYYPSQSRKVIGVISLNSLIQTFLGELTNLQARK
jgi:CBS domain containing-hemolysin-like protein